MEERKMTEKKINDCCDTTPKPIWTTSQISIIEQSRRVLPMFPTKRDRDRETEKQGNTAVNCCCCCCHM